MSGKVVDPKVRVGRLEKAVRFLDPSNERKCKYCPAEKLCHRRLAARTNGRHVRVKSCSQTLIEWAKWTKVDRNS
jgi:predicted SprT family Zn-dependent metalloprotease